MANRSTGTTNLRLFVALDPPPGVCAEVAGWARQAAGSDRRMRPVPARNCHITLAFIGKADESAVAPIDEAIEASAAAVTGLSLGAPVWLPRRRPRALALEVHDGRGDLEACHHRLAEALGEAIGWEPERRFRPHLTAIRLGRGVLPGKTPLPVSPALDFDGEAVTLYRSRLLPEGAQYDPLVRVRLQPRPGTRRP